MKTMIKHMKWWGWGDEKTEFDITIRPQLWSYIAKVVGIKELKITSPVISMDNIKVRDCKITDECKASLRKIFSDDQLKFDDYERVIHAYGKSCRDLIRVRTGDIQTMPDMVCYPESEEEVQALIACAVQHNVVVIPFGGGTNIAGCLEVRDPQQRAVISLDLRRMNQVLALDTYSRIARIQPGALGPEIEAVLNAQNMTLGHFPDSFEFSSIGGWVATRSAGMQSDKYGKIEDIVISIRMVTPTGTLVTCTVPKASNGINVNHLGIGSEGIFGVITEVTVQIHPLPEHKQSYGYLFPDFKSGIAAMYECMLQGCNPDMTRLNDADKTALSFAYQTKKSWSQILAALGFKAYLSGIKRFSLDKSCLMLVTFSGKKHKMLNKKNEAQSIYKKFGAVFLGEGPGKAFERGKYDFPYLRDFMLDRNVSADVSETATTWSNIIPLYNHARDAILDAISKTGVQAWCGCHISHTYHTGASLYFTFAFKQSGNALSQYAEVKNAAENAFIQHGGTLSHHHAVGYEHMPWLSHDISSTGIEAIYGIKQRLDATGIMNPGKIIENVV